METKDEELSPEDMEKIRLNIKVTNLYLETIFYGTGILAFVIYIIQNILMR